MRINIFKAKSLYVLIIVLVISSLLYINLTNNFKNRREITTIIEENNSLGEILKIASPSEPIYINNNWSAAKAAGICTGSGTYNQPYLIEDLVIDGGGSRSCILIENSIVHFIILNCTVFNSGGSPHLLHAGIHLAFVSNGQIINNTCFSHTHGILFSARCTEDKVKGNYVANNEIGIRTYYEGDFNTFSSNIVINNNEGISIDGDNNNIINNNATHNSVGISIIGSRNTIKKNYLKNNIQGVNLIESGRNTISENDASFNTHSGIRLSQSSRNIISGNTVNNNTVAGLYLSYESNTNTISSNHATNNEYGIYLITTRDNVISGNYLGGNEVCVFERDCQGNEFSDNSGCDYGESDDNILLYVILIVGGVSVIGAITIIEIRKVRKRKESREANS
ncbi:MAG: nitrous oxide reductase family maturation protein NosD [Candidatus Hermodarchaeota archaeon]